MSFRDNQEEFESPVQPRQVMDEDVDVEGIAGIDEYLEGGPAEDADGAPDDQGGGPMDAAAAEGISPLD